MSSQILVINSGSSSLKYQLIEPTSGNSLATGLIERIGEAEGHVSHRSAGEHSERSEPIADHGEALRLVRQMFAATGRPLEDDNLAAVGHRVVHGGPLYGDPVIVDDDVLRQIHEFAELAPLHNPANAIGIERARVAFSGIPQVAVFDTAFFRDLPPVAATYAIDRAIAEKNQIRRYGFHGTSHQYVSEQVAAFLDRDPAHLNQVVLHLGNGASVSAIAGGKPVDTSMGMSPLEGLVMGSRSGDLDPGIPLHLQRTAGFDANAVDQLLNHRSGLVGLSGIKDMRDLLRAAADGDADAALALDLYCYRIRKYVGAYFAVLGGVDTITFTAGVGENAVDVRARALAGLERMGIVVDPGRNAAETREPRVISPPESPVSVLVVPTNEELAIARAAAALIG